MAVPNVSPSGMTKQQFLKLKKKNPERWKNATWEGVYTWQYRTRQQREAQRRSDSASRFGEQFYQTPRKTILQDMRRLYPNNPMYAPLTDKQIQSRAQGMVNPMFEKQIEQLTNLIQSRSKAGTEAIRGYTDSYLKTMPQVQANVANAYATAQNAQAGMGSAFADFVRNSGGNMAAELAAAEQAAGQTSSGSAQLAPVNAGALAAVGAADFSTATRLNAEGAAANAYTAQLPSIANAWSAQTLGDFQGDLNQQLVTGTEDIQARSREAYSQVAQWMMDRELQKAQGRDAILGDRANYYAMMMGQNNDNMIAGSQLAERSQGAADGFVGDMAGVTGAGSNDPPPEDPIVARWADISGDISAGLQAAAYGSFNDAGIQTSAPLPWPRLFALTKARIKAAIPNASVKQIHQWALNALAQIDKYPPKKKVPGYREGEDKRKAPRKGD